ncbi:MAG: 3-methylornithyl-N6-L-lysine dehydrogenase PylD [Bacillota bacterium]|nr:3-methylornithyl-N6-L-lysine dehydrogenase PylD [Bacillota bacterium]
MTRLQTEWIKNMEKELPQWAKHLEEQSNMSLFNLAALGGDISRGRLKSASWRVKVGVVPVTAGLGIIGTFCQQVAAIIAYMGFETFITEATDVSGIYEATQKGAGVIFLADDTYFLAMNLSKNLVSENSDATARGFVAAMEGAAGGLRDKEVLVIGGGRVGRSALNFLKCRGAEGVLYDNNEEVLKEIKKEGFNVIHKAKDIKKYPLVVDCSFSDAGWLKKDMLHSDLLFASPAVPLSLDDEAAEFYENRIIHDLLQLGVITMLAMVC